MMTVETIGRIRRAYFVEKKAIREIVRELRVSRKTVRKAIRKPGTKFRYERRVQPQPQLGPFIAQLEEMLEANAKRPARERLTARRLYELLRADGYAGAYDSVQRHVRQWRRARAKLPGDVFIPLWFAPGEAYQFSLRMAVHLIAGGVGHEAEVAIERAEHDAAALAAAAQALDALPSITVRRIWASWATTLPTGRAR